MKKTHRKQSFESHDNDPCRSFPRRFNRPIVDAVRDWPKGCGNFIPPKESKVIGDNVAVRTAGNFQAPGEDIDPSSCSSTIHAEVRRQKVRSCHVVRDFPAGLRFASSSAGNISISEEFSAELRPSGQEMRDDSAYDGAIAKRSYEGSSEIRNNFGGGVGEITGFVGKWDGDARKVRSLLGQKIQDAGSSRSSIERSGCKETGNEVPNDSGGDDVKEICSSLGQEIQGGEDSRDGETSGFSGRRDGEDAKVIHIHHQSERGLSELDPWCQKVENKADQGKNVLRNTVNEIEISGKGKISKDHQEIGMNNRVERALNLFQEVLEKLKREANLTGQKMNHRKLPMVAAMTLKGQQNWVNTTKQLGHVPGIEVGATFRYRVELAIVGLHCHFQNGIDYMQKDGKVLAISVVDSGRYANAKESSDVLIYSGQGGNPMVGHDKQPEDQKLERGNLALKNSFGAKTPVRVTRGFQAINTTSNGYTYDGLYFVDKYWQEIGQFGTLVYKFQLKRMTGEPKFDRRELSLSKKSKVCRKTLSNDISLGKEAMPIPVVNEIDSEKPRPFTYIARIAYSEGSILSVPSGCDCTNGCSDSVKCACVVLKNGGEIPFNCHGNLTKQNPWIYECGPFCQCPPSCNIRVTQNGIKLPLQIFKTKSTGWGVRSRNYIPTGSFICEYVGELIIQDKEVERRAAANDHKYLFGFGNGGFTIDSTKFGNVGRFIKHSSSPNLYAQKVLYDHNDKRMPHIMLFAAKNIPPMRELTYRYNHMEAQVFDINGKLKQK